MHVIVWKYIVTEAHRQAFEVAYGPSGDWAKLFARHDGYRGTDLIRCDDDAYLTIDRWDSVDSFHAFMNRWRSDYDVLDARLEALTESEQLVGRGLGLMSPPTETRT